MTIEHVWEDKGLNINYTGTVTGQDLINSAIEIGGDARFDDARYVLSDWTQVESKLIDPSHVIELAAYVSAMAKSNPRIINISVVIDEEERTALVGLYTMLTEDMPWQMETFFSVNEARRWLFAHL